MVIVSNPEQYEQQDTTEKSIKHKTKAADCKSKKGGKNNSKNSL